jgi:hypothetical protein
MYNGGKRSGSGSFGRNNAGADSHAAMHDETRIAGENWDAINIA